MALQQKLGLLSEWRPGPDSGNHPDHRAAQSRLLAIPLIVLVAFDCWSQREKPAASAGFSRKVTSKLQQRPPAIDGMSITSSPS